MALSYIYTILFILFASNFYIIMECGIQTVIGSINNLHNIGPFSPFSQNAEINLKKGSIIN